VGAFGEWDVVVLDGNYRSAALSHAGRVTHPAILVFDDVARRRPADLRQLGQTAGFGLGSSIRRSKPAGMIETT
jgi:hypothetical protein